MNRPVYLALIAMLLVGTSVCLANSGESLQQENANLRNRIERLENALEEMKKASQANKSAAGAKSGQSGTSAEVKAQNTDVANLQKENELLKQRLAKLEAAIGDLKTAKPSPSPASAAAAAPAPAPAAPAAAAKKEPAPGGVTPPAAAAPATAPAAVPAPAPVPPVPPAAPAPAPAAAPAPERKDIWSSLDIQLYGYVKLDASYDTSRTTPGNYAGYVDSEATNENDNEFNMTVNQTRMGFNITGPTVDDMKTSGCIEFDFFGNYAAENKAKIQMRLGYMKLDWAQSQFAILAGQAADVISPLNPYTLNYLVLWQSGNIGYRRPQLRVTQGFALNDQTTLKLEAAAVRTLGRTTTVTTSETGEDSGYPTAQGRISLTFPFFGPKPTTVGVSGHFGEEEYDVNAAGDNTHFRSWSGNLDLTQPICPGVTLLGEFFIGEDLDNYFGGISQGVNTTTMNEIASKGGWAAVSLGPWAQWSLNVGGGADSVNADDLNTGNKTYNSCVFGNALFAINKNVTVGMELSQWTTRYKGPGDADDTRVQGSLIYKF